MEQSRRGATHEELHHQLECEARRNGRAGSILKHLQDIQSQNNYGTTQLNILGYKGDVLRVQFCLDKISERKALAPVTVANTRERQEILATVHTHGKNFL